MASASDLRDRWEELADPLNRVRLRRQYPFNAMSRIDPRPEYRRRDICDPKTKELRRDYQRFLTDLAAWRKRNPGRPGNHPSALLASLPGKAIGVLHG